jgi:predicted DCC family thiol-disulfide oxidoreductase YuxK
MTAPIVVFDGECGLCNGFVAWLVRRDKHAVYLLAGSAGPVGRAVIDAAGLPREISESTIIVWDGNRARIQSDAVLAILAGLPWPWRAAGAGFAVPRRWRDTVYRWRAARRDRVEAEDPACGVPPPQLLEAWRSRLATLDDVRGPVAPESKKSPPPE